MEDFSFLRFQQMFTVLIFAEIVNRCIFYKELLTRNSTLMSPKHKETPALGKCNLNVTGKQLIFIHESSTYFYFISISIFLYHKVLVYSLKIGKSLKTLFWEVRDVPFSGY